MKKQIITLAVTGLLLSGCGIYTKYEPTTSVPDQLYGGEVVTEDTASLGNMDWRELFTDPHLQSLIEQGLQNNTDYQSAELRVEEAQATLMSAKLAFLPAFALAPQGTHCPLPPVGNWMFSAVCAMPRSSRKYCMPKVRTTVRLCVPN